MRVLDSAFAKPGGDVEAANSVVAEDDDGFLAIFELSQTGRNGSHGNEHGAIDAGQGVFVGFADVDEEDGLALGKNIADGFHGDFKGDVRHAASLAPGVVGTGRLAEDVQREPEHTIVIIGDCLNPGLRTRTYTY